MNYSYKGNYPMPLPDRIRLSSGLTVTDKSTFTDEQVADAGYTAVDVQPEFNEHIEKVIWNSEKIDWEIIPLTEQEIQALKTKEWANIRSERDEIINSIQWRIQRYESEVRLGLDPTEDIVKLDQYIQDLRDITKQPDPFNIEWPALAVTGAEVDE